MKIVALMPASRAAHATAWPWLPALAATTPARRSPLESVAILLTAPRTLNEPVRWRFSAFRQTSRPASFESVSEPYTGVTRAIPSSRARASSISLSVGAVSTANLEHLPHDLADRTQRVELPLLNLVEKPPQLRILGDRFLEMGFCPRRRNGEDLAGEIAATLLLQPPLGLEEGAVLLDLRPELGHVLAAGGLGQHDRRPPSALLVEREHRAHFVEHRLGCRMVHFVDRDHVWNLHDPSLERLDRVPGARHQHEHDRVGDFDHLDLALAGAHGLEENEVLAGRVEDEHRLQRRLREPALVAAGSHRADEDLRVEEVVGQADPVAEERSLRERARGVDRDHADGAARLADVADERADQRRLADSGWPGHADRVGLSGLGIELTDDLVGERLGVLDQRDRAGERPPVAGPDAGRKRFTCELAARCHGWMLDLDRAGDGQRLLLTHGLARGGPPGETEADDARRARKSAGGCQDPAGADRVGEPTRDDHPCGDEGD